MQTATQLAIKFGVTEMTFRQWTRLRGFPITARRQIGTRVYWEYEPIAAWHQNRPSAQRERLAAKLSSYEKQ